MVPGRDLEKAKEYFLDAARQGWARAQLRMGLLYASGEGVPFDLKEAYMWFKIAGHFGDPRGDVEAERILGRLPSLAIKDAELHIGRIIEICRERWEKEDARYCLSVMYEKWMAGREADAEK